MKHCKEEGCTKKAAARGLCWMHYRRQLRLEQGKPPGTPRSNAKQPCATIGCPHLAVARGICMPCKQRLRRANELCYRCAAPTGGPAYCPECARKVNDYRNAKRAERKRLGLKRT